MIFQLKSCESIATDKANLVQTLSALSDALPDDYMYDELYNVHGGYGHDCRVESIPLRVVEK